MKNTPPTTTPTQRIEIEIGPSGPAVVRVLEGGRFLEEASRLASVPGSGWTIGEGGSCFLVEPKLVAPRPLRKGRPDASARMAEYNKARWGGGKESGKIGSSAGWRPKAEAGDFDF